MKIVISPAKSLDLSTKVPTGQVTQAVFLEKAQVLQNVVKQKTPADLGALMKISEKLAALNWQRNQDWQLPITPDSKDAKAAVYAFNGDVYTGLDAYSLSPENTTKMQNTLRILSGLYGILKPLDLILPYRLEMGTKLAVADAKNLYDFWKPTLTDFLNQELQPQELLVNLASTEYFSAIAKKEIQSPVITPHFKDLKNGKLKVISFYAKKARGTMARYLIENDIQTLDQIKAFTKDGYVFSALETKKENEPVFIR